MKHYDICVITAANETQAQGYRRQLRWRRGRGMLPGETEFLVCADPEGRRIGSGGSTLYVLRQLRRKAGGVDEAFRNKRILILHSGGDSRRLPAYSATGKIFTPLPTERFFALFDALLDQLVGLPALDGGQVVVASGDVLLTFDPGCVAFAERGITGVAYPDLPQVASGHGVYVTSSRSDETNPRKVVDFLQKPSLDDLKAAKALDLANRAFVDTGIMNLAMDAVEALAALDASVERVVQGEVRLDLYKEVPFALLGKPQDWEARPLSGVPFSVSQLPYCGFFHIGASAQFLRSLYTLTHAGALYDFRNLTRTWLKPSASVGGAFIYNSMIETDQAQGREPALVEGCHLSRPVVLEGDNILTGVPQDTGPIRLEHGVCLSVVPVQEDLWAAILYGIHDDFKHSLGEEKCVLLNGRFTEWLDRTRISPTELWDGEARELWSAKLFPVSADPARAVGIALGLQGHHPDVEAWRASDRMSLNEILRSANHDRLLDAYAGCDRRTKLTSITAALTPASDLSSREVLSWPQQPEDYARLAKDILSMLGRSDDPLFKARLYKLLSDLVREARTRRVALDVTGVEISAEELENKAFALIRDVIGRGMGAGEHRTAHRMKVRADEVVWVCLPARLDFAGGWLDTPPQCLERGGSVLNAAVTLNGQYPIQVIGKPCRDPVIRINSIDLGDRVVLADTKELLSYSDPSDWLALPKSAFVAAGIVSPEEDRSLADLLGEYGAGIDLTLFSAVPSGSGLGASSILGAGIITCLARMFGLRLAQDEVFRRTLYMEQLMTTGGGWQDQIGGVVGGVKLIRTEPGASQSPHIAWTELALPGMPLSNRFLLYYTGLRRMAKNILRQVVGRYLGRDPGLLDAMDRLRALSVAMKDALDRRDVASFGEQVAEVWRLNKQLDEGSTNDQIESILYQISAWTLGAKLLGAGGGGFLFIVSKGEEETRKIRQALTDHPPNDLARFFDFDVERGGMKVSVL